MTWRANGGLPEGPVELLLRAARRGDVDGEEELLEVDEAVLVGVEGPEHVITEFVGVPRREALAIDLHEGRGGQLAVWAVRLEALVPLLDRVLVVAGRRLEELEVVLRQPVLASLGAHGVMSNDRAAQPANETNQRTDGLPRNKREE